MAVVVFFCVDQGEMFFTTAAFLIGAITSMFCGAFGMQIATFANCRTTICAKQSLGYAFKTAFRAGCVMGFTLVSVALIILFILIQVYKNLLDINDTASGQDDPTRYY
jgi:Na+/H+-translocating membrane pyrophosphatase